MSWKLFFISFAALIAIIVAEEVNHHCGVGSVSGFFSRLISFGCDSQVLSEVCCKPHDTCYDEVEARNFLKELKHRGRMTCDESFGECIWNKCYPEESYCRSWITFTHVKAVNLARMLCNALNVCFYQF